MSQNTPVVGSAFKIAVAVGGWIILCNIYAVRIYHCYHPFGAFQDNPVRHPIFSLFDRFDAIFIKYDFLKDGLILT